MSPESNKQVVREYLERVVGAGDRAAAERLVAADVVFASPYTPEPAHGRDAFLAMIGTLRDGFPDLRIEERAVVAEGDLVAARWVATGTQEGEFAGLGATGRGFRIDGMSFYRVAGGLIVEGWVNDDSLGMLTQLGALPAPAPA